MTPEVAVMALDVSLDYFERGTRCFTEEDADFTPQEERFTVKHHVAHVAQTIDWFVEGVFGGNGFDLDFESQEKKVRSAATLADARQWLRDSVANAKKVYGESTAEALAEPIPNDNIMGGAPRGASISAITDHNAHHRGALAVYARLAGRVPAMPYMDME